MHIVYALTNSFSEKCYIGKTCKPFPYYLKYNLQCAARGSKAKPSLYNAMRKYPHGWRLDSIFEFEDESSAYRIERLLIALFDTQRVGYNVAWGGLGGRKSVNLSDTPKKIPKDTRFKIGFKHSEESKRKIGEASKLRRYPNRKAWNKGKPVLPHVLAAMNAARNNEALKGRAGKFVRTEEYKHKLSLATKAYWERKKAN